MGLRVVELFAGVGGFRLGLEEAGHEVVWSNQWEPKIQAQHAFDCYVERFGDGPAHTNVDVAEVDVDDVPDHDLLVGGFPCQDYSVATTLDKAKGLEGNKGVLWWQIVRIVDAKNPPFLLLENVNRLLRSPADQRGRDFGVVLKSLEELGYRAEWRVINAADYGFATKRRRVFIFAAREDTPWGQLMAERGDQPGYLHERGFFPRCFPVEKPEQAKLGVLPPDATLPDELATVSSEFAFDFEHAGLMVDGKIWTTRPDPITKHAKPIRKLLEEDVPERYYIPEDTMEDWEYHKGAKEEERTADNGYEYTYKEGGMRFPDPIDEPARTILTSEGRTTASRSRHVIRDPHTERLRILTPLEVERIMGFPDDWTDTGMPEHWRYFCMGNALVVGLVERMGGFLSAWPSEGQPGLSHQQVKAEPSSHPANLCGPVTIDL